MALIITGTFPLILKIQVRNPIYELDLCGLRRSAGGGQNYPDMLQTGIELHAYIEGSTTYLAPLSLYIRSPGICQYIYSPCTVARASK